MVSPAAAQKFGKDFGRHPVGTGPFQFVEWVPDDHLTLERFPQYWDNGEPRVDRLVYRIVPDSGHR
jgi:ABC-type transport system substrate-binding protein